MQIGDRRYRRAVPRRPRAGPGGNGRLRRRAGASRPGPCLKAVAERPAHTRNINVVSITLAELAHFAPCPAMGPTPHNHA